MRIKSLIVATALAMTAPAHADSSDTLKILSAMMMGGGLGQIIPGVNIGSMMSGQLQGVITQGSGTWNTTSLNPMALFQSQPRGVSIPGPGSTIGGLYGGFR